MRDLGWWRKGTEYTVGGECGRGRPGVERDMERVREGQRDCMVREFDKIHPIYAFYVLWVERLVSRASLCVRTIRVVACGR